MPRPRPVQQADTPARFGVPQAGAVRSALVVADLGKRGVRDFRTEFLPWLRARVANVELAGDVPELVRARNGLTDEQAVASLPDLVIVLGGDGAILAAVRAFAASPVPTIGINFGRVGFLASTPAAHWKEALSGVLAGEGVLEPRMRLQAEFVRDGEPGVKAVALNDVLVARGTAPGMVALGLSVDGNWVADYRADGLIIATPSGSTAHSLSAGGPVLFPSMLGMIVTPVSPQGLSYRPIVLHPDSRLEIVVKEVNGETILVIDGQGFHTIRVGELVRIVRHPLAYPLLAWAQLDPYRRLRDRLGWSETRYREGDGE